MFVEYAKAAPDDILIRITVANRGPEAARAAPAADALVPQHLDAGGGRGEGYWPQAAAAPRRRRRDRRRARRRSGRFALRGRAGAGGARPTLLFTENETNVERLFGAPNATPYVKDAFHELRGRTADATR